jgi:hypothetical protein
LPQAARLLVPLNAADTLAASCLVLGSGPHVSQACGVTTSPESTGTAWQFTTLPSAPCATDNRRNYRPSQNLRSGWVEQRLQPRTQLLTAVAGVPDGVLALAHRPQIPAPAHEALRYCCWPTNWPTLARASSDTCGGRRAVQSCDVLANVVIEPVLAGGQPAITVGLVRPRRGRNRHAGRQPLRTATDPDPSIRTELATAARRRHPSRKPKDGAVVSYFGHLQKSDAASNYLEVAVWSDRRTKTSRRRSTRRSADTVSKVRSQ